MAKFNIGVIVYKNLSSTVIVEIDAENEKVAKEKAADYIKNLELKELKRLSRRFDWQEDRLYSS